MQQWTQLEDDSGGFRLTIAKWLTPDKTWVHGVGHHARTSWSPTRPPSPADDPVIDAALKALGDDPTGSAPVPALRPAAERRPFREGNSPHRRSACTARRVCVRVDMNERR